MQKILLFNLDLLKSCEYTNQEYHDVFINMLKHLNINENAICFYSRNQSDLRKYEAIINNDNYKFFTRARVNEILQKNNKKANYFVVIGRKEQDFLMAIHNGLLFLVPNWMPAEEKAIKYGVKIDTADQLLMIIESLNNQNYWYSKIEVSQNMTVLSLMDARYGKYADTYHEKDMLYNFERILKSGASRSYYEILLYHFLSAITNETIFDDIKLWGIIPSSNCDLNLDMLYFKEQVRYIKAGYEPSDKTYPNVLLRHDVKTKAHNTDWMARKNYGASKEFETMCINPAYYEKINKLRADNSFNVCIFDDYLTHGNSFEAVRNIFTALGANKIVCVSLGSFCTCYQKNDYILTGNLYSKKYTYEHETCEEIYRTSEKFEINAQAKKEIDNLYNIFNR